MKKKLGREIGRTKKRDGKKKKRDRKREKQKRDRKTERETKREIGRGRERERTVICRNTSPHTIAGSDILKITYPFHFLVSFLIMIAFIVACIICLFLFYARVHEWRSEEGCLLLPMTS